MNTEETNNENVNEASADQHSDSHERSKPSYDDVNIPVVVLVGIISMVLTFVTIWFVEGIYYKWNNDLVQSRTYGVDNTIQSEMVANQMKVLDGDEERGITSVESVLDEVVQQFHNADEHSGQDHAADEESGESHDDESHNDEAHDEEGGDDH